MNRTLLHAFTLTLLCSAQLVGQTSDAEWENVERIVAIGDIHGSYDNFVSVLQNAELIDSKLRWIGGTAHLVQNGDILDRGPESRKAMDLLMKLEDKAEDAGGRVHALIGNHEVMNVVGILDLVSEGEYAAFVDRDSRKRREQTFERIYDQMRREARKNNEDATPMREAKKKFEEDFPLGWIEHRRAFGKDGRYGRWITKHNTAIKINGIMFSHGDWSEEFSERKIDALNKQVRQELKGELPVEGGIIFDVLSPLQYRGFANTKLTRTAQQAEEQRIDRTLANLGASRMVVGHTLAAGLIESRFGGKHISIDVGMLNLYRGGHRIALEIEGEELRAIHDGGKIPIHLNLDESTLDDYVRAVAEVDPTNVDVQLKLVDMHNEQGRSGASAPILERLFEQNPNHVPLRYRDLLGIHYLNTGDEAKAEEQFMLYISSLSQLVAKNPANVNLANLLARLCLDKGLELELAEQTIRDALARAPTNANFQLTLARVHLAKNAYREALAVLTTFPEANSVSYDVHYFTGLAYLGLDDRKSAKTAFEDAVGTEPSRDEAKRELEKLEATSEDPPALDESEVSARRHDHTVRRRAELSMFYFFGGTTASLQAFATRNFTTVFFGI